MVLKCGVEHSALGTDQKTGTTLDISTQRNSIEELVTQVLEALQKPKRQGTITQRLVL